MFFEALAAASIALGLAIPVFLERAMRPRYEERFEEFRMDNRVSFVLAFEKALDKLRRLKRSEEAMTPEVYATMEGLFNQWGQLRSSENKLVSLRARRGPLFVAWMFSFAISIVAIQYPNVVAIAPTLTIADAATADFFLTLAYSVKYVLELFDLDNRLSRYGRSVSQSSEPPAIIPSRSIGSLHSDIMNNVNQVLRINKIPFVQEPRLLRSTRRPDYAVPSAKNPVAFIEVKSGTLARAASYPIAYLGQELKIAYPAVTNILIVPNTQDLRLMPTVRKYWDSVLGFTDMGDLAKIVNERLSGQTKDPKQSQT